MKVAECRIAGTSASLALHAAGLLLLVLVSHSVVPVVGPAQPQPRVTPLVAPPAFASREPSAAPSATSSSASVVEPAVGRFDDATKPDEPARTHAASDRVVTGTLPGPNDIASAPSGQTGKIVVGEFGGAAGAPAATTPGSPGIVRLASAFGDSGSGSEDGSEGVEPPRLLSAPAAAYTDEALRLGVRGSVVLKVRLTASGSIYVLGIVHSLGHGLDETAMAAAKAMQFVPARRSGSSKPVDSIATVMVVFDLA
jgi:TonB family protein